MNRSTVEEIKARIPIEDLIGNYVKLEKAGKSFKAKCPFHNEKSASFFISPERGGYYCFGCGAKGDIFSFVEQFEGLDFKGALKVLAEKAGVPLVMDAKADSELDRLREITEQTAKYFEDQYGKSAEAQEYLRGRGISPETRASFRIGWAPDAWKHLHAYLKTKGWNDAIMEKAGLIKKGDKGDYYDRFRGRIVFPITDSSGRVVAFTGRILKDDGKSAKYLNSPDTPLFNKSAILFGLDKAKSEIRRVGYSILVEGQMDLVLSHQVGVKNTIAASGTALTDQSKDESGVVSNLGMVRRLSPNMIIALDSDKAGRTAAMRAVAATALSMGMSVKIADIEGGKDPADLILNDPESWKTVLKNAKHVIEFELGNVLREVTDPHKQPRAVRERVFPFLARIDSEMDKGLYVKMIAEKVGLSDTAIWEDLRKFEKTVKNPGTLSASVGSRMSAASASQSNLPDSRELASETRSEDRAGGGAGKLVEREGRATDQTGDKLHRIDLVERRIFGLLALMDQVKLPQANEYRLLVMKIAGDSYGERVQRVDPILSDLLFESEALFGNEKERLPTHMDELLLNFEEDLINGDLMKAMGELRTAEKAGNAARVAELAGKCQELSKKKVEIGKKRKH